MSITSGPITDLSRIDVWLSSGFLRLAIERNERGVIVPRHFTTPQDSPYTILYFLFALDILQDQVWLRCPVNKKGCRKYFKIGTRGRPPRTCCNPACRTAMSRHPENYLQEVEL